MWIVLWIGYLATHGSTMFDNQQEVFALTWYDISKFVVFALFAFVFGLVSLRAVQAGRSGRLGTAGYLITMIGFGFLLLGALGFWLIPWGSYVSLVRETQMYISSNFMLFLSPVILGVGMILFGIEFLKMRVLSRGNWLPLIIGITAFSPYLLWTNFGFLFGAAWSVLGVVLITEDAGAA